MRELRYLKNWVLDEPKVRYFNPDMERKVKTKLIKMIEEKVKLAKDMRYLKRKEANAKITKWIPRGTFYDGSLPKGGMSGK